MASVTAVPMSASVTSSSPCRGRATAPKGPHEEKAVCGSVFTTSSASASACVSSRYGRLAMACRSPAVFACPALRRRCGVMTIRIARIMVLPSPSCLTSPTYCKVFRRFSCSSGSARRAISMTAYRLEIVSIRPSTTVCTTTRRQGAGRSTSSTSFSGRRTKICRVFAVPGRNYRSRPKRQPSGGLTRRPISICHGRLAFRSAAIFRRIPSRALASLSAGCSGLISATTGSMPIRLSVSVIGTAV